MLEYIMLEMSLKSNSTSKLALISLSDIYNITCS
jgi:hypothetical protein